MCSCPMGLQDSLIIKIPGGNNQSLHFLHGNSNQGKIACKTATTGSVWPAVPCQARHTRG